jgi:peptidylprolyl isomerase
MKSPILKASLISLAMPALVLLVATGCGGGGDKTATATQPAANATRPSNTPKGGSVIISNDTPTPGNSNALTPRTGDFASLCQKSGDKQFSSPQTVIDPTRSYTATISTDKGDISLDLYPDVAPVTVNSFVFLACKGFYEGVTFHRVIAGFVAQAGDPTGTGSGGPGYTIPDEFSDRPFDTGTLGMAKTAAPNSGGSQFFICLAPQTSLNGQYTVFGKVTSGMDVVNKLTPRNPSTPSLPAGDKILSITVQEH